MILEVKNFRKAFDNCVAVDNLSFTLKTGEITGFVGPNGAGKTTTMRIMATLEQCDEGEMLLNGVSTLEYPENVRKQVGFVPDSLPLNNDISIHEYLDFFARAYGIKAPERQAHIEQLEEFTNIKGIRDKMLDNLSKGMKQRVSIARALISNPDFILMDEPAAGLDPRARIELRELLKVLCEQGKGILISSHILTELSEICTSTVIIEKGRLLKSGNIDKVIAETASGDKRVIQIKLLENLEGAHNHIILSPSVSDISAAGDNIEFAFSGTDEEAHLLLKDLIEKGFKVISFNFKQQNLETVFMNITRGEVQ